MQFTKKINQVFGFVKNYSAAILIILAAPKTETLPIKTQSPDNILKLAKKSFSPSPPKTINKIGIISGKAITATIEAELVKTAKLPQKVVIKLMEIVANKISSKKFWAKSRSKPANKAIGKIEIKIGKALVSQFASIFARMKVSKLSIEPKICSIVPSSKSFLKNSLEEKIKQESNEKQIIKIE